MELLKKKKLLIALISYVSVLLVILFISNLSPFNEWFSKLLRLLRPVLIGLGLAYLLNPFFRFYERKLFYKLQPSGLRRVISLILTYLTLLLIFVVLLLLIVPQLTDSIMDFARNYEQHLQSAIADVQGLVTRINEFLPKKEDGSGVLPPVKPEAVKAWIADFLATLEISSETFLSMLTMDNLSALIEAAGSLVALIADTLFGLFISIYFLNTKEKRYAQIMRMRKAIFSDRVNGVITNICATADRSFGGFLRGKILDSAIVGVLVYFAISLLGVPYAILIACIVAITDIVPIIGPFIGVIPSAVIILLTDPAKVIPFVLCILVVQQIDGNIIAPKILGEHTGVSSLCVMISITTLGSLWGLAGMVLGVPLFATVLDLTNNFLNRKLEMKGLPVQTESYYSAELTAVAGSELDMDIPKKKKQKNYEWRQVGINSGEGDLTAFEHFCLDTYALAQKHKLFSDKAAEQSADFAEEEAELQAVAAEEISLEIAEKEAPPPNESADITKQP